MRTRWRGVYLTNSRRAWLRFGRRRLLLQPVRVSYRTSTKRIWPQSRQGAFSVSQLDLSALLQQAQALQEKLKQAQESLASRTVDGDSGGGMVRVTVDGAMQV